LRQAGKAGSAGEQEIRPEHAHRAASRAEGTPRTNKKQLSKISRQRTPAIY
jgi:hypothetical protein